MPKDDWRSLKEVRDGYESQQQLQQAMDRAANRWLYAHGEIPPRPKKRRRRKRKK